MINDNLGDTPKFFLKLFKDLLLLLQASLGIRPIFLYSFILKGYPKISWIWGWLKRKSDPKSALILTLILTFRNLFPLF